MQKDPVFDPGKRPARSERQREYSQKRREEGRKGISQSVGKFRSFWFFGVVVPVGGMVCLEFMSLSVRFVAVFCDLFCSRLVRF